MGNTLRCCLACVLPCGALDLIRVVHLNGSVDELSGPSTAAAVLNNHPNHVLTKPSAHRRILILSPDSQLQRGSIYFLIPSSSLPAGFRNTKSRKKSPPSEIVPAGKAAPEKKLSSRRRRRTGSRINEEMWQPRLESISEN